MEKLKIEYKFNLEDFKTMENTEHTYFPDENITVAQEVFKWYEKNDLTCVGVRNSDNKIIGNVNILPIKQGIFENIYENKMHEADITAEQIEKYENNHSYYIYLASISIDMKYRNQYKVINTLLKGCLELFNLLKEKNIKIEKVMADASTIHGEKICKKLLDMNYVRETNHQSKIYCENGEKFMNTIRKLSRRMLF